MNLPKQLVNQLDAANGIAAVFNYSDGAWWACMEEQVDKYNHDESTYQIFFPSDAIHAWLDINEPSKPSSLKGHR